MLTYASLLDMITLICTNHYNRTISSPLLHPPHLPPPPVQPLWLPSDFRRLWGGSEETDVSYSRGAVCHSGSRRWD